MFRLEWGLPGAAGLIAHILPPGEFSEARPGLRGKCEDRAVRERGAERNGKLVDSICKGLKVGGDVWAFACRVGSLVI